MGHDLDLLAHVPAQLATTACPIDALLVTTGFVFLPIIGQDVRRKSTVLPRIGNRNKETVSAMPASSRVRSLVAMGKPSVPATNSPSA